MRKLTICQNLFDTWNTFGVRYCHWKGTANIEKGFTGESDLDIFVHPEDNDIAAKILEQNNFVHFYTQWGQRYPFIQDWIGLDKETGILVHVHYHNRMMVGHTGVMEYVYPWEQDVLSSRILDSKTGLYIINPEYEALTFFSRLGLEFPNKKLKKESGNRYSFNEEAKAEIDYIRANIDEEKLKALFIQYYGEEGTLLFDFYKTPQLDKTSLKALSKITKRTIPHEGVSVLNELKSYYVKFILRYIFPRQHLVPKKKIPLSQKGLSIIFIGQDGSGKSVVSRDIKKWLSWKNESRLYYLGFGEQYMPWSRRLQERMHNRKGLIARLVCKWLSFQVLLQRSKDTVKALKYAKKYIKKGGIAVFDRFPQNKVVGINDGPKIRYLLIPLIKGRILKRIAVYFANKEEQNIEKSVQFVPDIVFKLCITVEETMRRKPSENMESVKEKHEIVNSMSFSDSRVYKIDAAIDYQKEIIEIKNIIWNNIQKL